MGQDDPWSKILWFIFWYDGPNHIDLNKISAYIHTSNGTGTRLESDLIIQKRNDYELENHTKQHK